MSQPTSVGMNAVGQDAAAHSFVLTDIVSRVHHESIDLGPRDLCVDSAAPWRVSKVTLRGGKQDGVGLITIDNGRLRIEILETRGLSLLRIDDGDLRLGWDSPIPEIVHPQWIDLHACGGTGWLDGFCELLVRCGLEFAGEAGRDVVYDVAGNKHETELTLHGRIGNTPASRVEVFAEPQPPYRVGVRGLVQERGYLGPALELESEIYTTPGEAGVQIVDTVINRSVRAQEFMLIYHTNFGPPLLGGGARVIAPIRSAHQRNDAVLDAGLDFMLCEPPTPRAEERVYFLKPQGDSGGQTFAALHDAAGERAVSLHWSLAEMPCLTLWQNFEPMGERDEGYVVALEPGVCHPNNRRTEREAGRVPVLAAGGRRRFALEMRLHQGSQQITELLQKAVRVRDG